MKRIKTHNPGDIIYYTFGSDVKKAVFCEHWDNNTPYGEYIVWELNERNVVDDGKGHEFFACRTVRPDEVFDSADEAIDAALAEHRRWYEASLKELAVTERQKEPLKKKEQPPSDENIPHTLQHLFFDDDGPHLRRAYALIRIHDMDNIYMAYLTTTDHLGYRIWKPLDKSPTQIQDYHLTEDIHVAEERAEIWYPEPLQEWKDKAAYAQGELVLE